MKLNLLFSLAAFVFVANLGVYSQCTLSGLQSVYCASDDPDTLTATCSGSPADVFGAGVNSQGVFNPASAGPGTHVITVIGDPDAYTVDVAGTFNPDTGSGTIVTLGDDALSSALNIGFSFRFFDNSYSTFNISSNGFISFGTNADNGCCSGDFIPSTATPNNIVAFAWQDLDPDGVGTIEYFTVGTAPNRKLIMNFADIPHYPGPGPNNNVTSQVQLLEGCGRIEIHTATQPNGFGVHTQGIENSGTVAYYAPGRNASAWTATNDYVAFVPDECTTDTVIVVAGPDLTFTADTIDCYSNTNGSATVTPGGTGSFTYLWDGGQTTSTITGLSAGIYSCTVTDQDGCASFGDVEVVAPLPLGAIFDITNTVCESGSDGAISTTPSGGTTPYSYQWDDPNNSILANISNLAPGTYNLTMTDVNGCSYNTSADVGFDNTDPVVDLGDEKGFCPGQSAVLVGPPGMDSYAWSTGDTVLSIVVNTAGIYSLTATDASGCTGEDGVTVTVFTPDQVDLGPTQGGPGPIMLDAGSQFVNYLWSTGASTQTISVSIPDDYSVTVTDTTGCNTSDTVKINVWPSGIEGAESAEIILYPNPAKDRVYLRSDVVLTNATVTLFDLSGREVSVLQTDLQPGRELPIDLSNMAAGTYFVRINSDDFTRDFKFTLE